MKYFFVLSVSEPIQTESMKDRPSSIRIHGGTRTDISDREGEAE